MRTYLLTKKGQVVVLRWLLFFVAAYLVTTGEARRPGLFAAVLGLFAASNVALGLLPERRYRRWNLNFAIVAFDVVFVSVMIYLTGDLNLYVFYFFTILLAAYGRSIRGSLLVAFAASVFYLWIGVRTGSISTLLEPALLIRLPFFYLVALISSFMAAESRSEEERSAHMGVVLAMTQQLVAAKDRAELLRLLRAALTGMRLVRGVDVVLSQGEGCRMLGAGGELEGPVLPRAACGLAGPGPSPAEGPQLLPEGLAGRPPGSRNARSLTAFGFALRDGGAGALLVHGDRPEGFDERAGELFAVAALSLARALDGLSAFEELRRGAAEVASLVRLSETFNSSLELKEVLRRVMENSRAFLQVEASSLLMLEESSGELVFEVATGEKGDAVRTYRLRRGEGVAGWVAEQGCPLIVNDPAREKRFFPEVDRGTGFVTRNLMAVPLLVRGRAIGVLEVMNTLPPGRPFEAEDLRRMEMLSGEAGSAIDRARLYTCMEEQVNETIEMYLSLEKEKGKLETILASMIEGVIVADESGTVALVNPAARRILSPDGARWLPEQERIAGFLRRAVAEQAEFTETLAPEPARGRIHRVRVAPIRTPARKLLGAVAVLEDVTELMQLSEMKSEFISQVSHELRTPLTSIRGAMALLARRRAGPLSAEQQELVSLVQDEVARMTALINDLLDLSKLESGLVRLEPEPLEVAQLLERLWAGLGVLAAEKRITLQRELPDPPLTVRADPRRVERVLANLLGNAIKYSPPGSTVTVGGGGWTEQSGPGGRALARFWVRDDGPGIAVEEQRRIFDKFQRGRGEGVESVPGTGLGLAIARQIVEEHGGTIWLESEPGAGSTFYFTLPLEPGRGAGVAGIGQANGG